MERNSRAIEVLNDLVRINNDRIVGYQKAIDETNEADADLRNVFNHMAQQSRRYSQELTDQVQRLGGEPASGTTASGKVYRMWMDVKSSFSGSERKSVLEECEYGEDAAQRAYEKALSPDTELSPEVSRIVQDEKVSLKASHDTIKGYRDMQRSERK